MIVAASARRSIVRLVLSFALGGLSAVPAWGNPESDALRIRGFNHAYSLDHTQAIAAFRSAIKADPKDSAAYRGLAGITWLHILFRRGTVMVDDYLGRVTKPTLAMRQPPPEAAATFRESVSQALALAERRLLANPKDADAHYQAGAALGLMASYTATVEGSVFAAFRAARRAYDRHERVLALDSTRKDAGLVAGIYRYSVSTLAAPVRWMAYLAGFGGGKERGLRMVEEAARYAGEAQTEAQFALVLLYNREKRFDEALQVIARLQQRYPRNRLLWLEQGSTALRAGRPADAEAALTRGLTMLAGDGRPRMFGEETLWMYKRGAARVALKKFSPAEADLRLALGREARDWVRGRAHLELGKIAAARSQSVRAREEIEAAVRLGRADNDPAGVEEAQRLLRSVR